LPGSFGATLQQASSWPRRKHQSKRSSGVEQKSGSSHYWRDANEEEERECWWDWLQCQGSRPTVRKTQAYPINASQCSTKKFAPRFWNWNDPSIESPRRPISFVCLSSASMENYIHLYVSQLYVFHTYTSKILPPSEEKVSVVSPWATPTPKNAAQSYRWTAGTGRVKAVWKTG